MPTKQECVAGCGPEPAKQDFNEYESWLSCVNGCPSDPSPGGSEQSCPGGAAPKPDGTCYPPRTDWTPGTNGGEESYQGYNLPGYPGGFNINSGQPPPFKAPRWSYPDFEPPKPEDIYKDPSYQWRLDQGVKALDRSAAARGTLRSGGTLLGAIEYGQKFGSHEYGNIFDRAVTTYGTNRQTSMDVFDRLYQAAKDEYAPQLLGWQTGVENQRISAQRSWEDWWRRVDDLWRREHAVLTAGQN